MNYREARTAIPAKRHRTFFNRYGFGIVAIFVVGVFLLAPHFGLAQSLDTGLNSINETGLGGANTDVRVLIARIIRGLLGFLGIIAIGVILYGGYLWMTAAGKSEQIETAKKVLQNGVIGLIIMLSAFAIVSFIISRLLGAIGGGGDNGGGGGGGCKNCTSLGMGIIEDHYPARNAKGVPRNTMVIITFKEPILVVPDNNAKENQSFIKDAVVSATCPTCWSGVVNTNIFTLVWKDVGGFVPFDDFKVYTNDEKTFVFQPNSLLGSPSFNSEHLATIKSALVKKDGQPGMLTDYVWPFEVSTIIDTTPPKIKSIFPLDKDTTPRNTTILITFNEAINPISVTGTTPPFDNIVVTYDDGDPATTDPVQSGIYEIGNNYRTVQFTSSVECGVNSCGENIYCLDGDKDVRVLVKAASLWGKVTGACPNPEPFGNPSRACSPLPSGAIFDGVADVAGNSLDGSRNEVAGKLKLPSGNGTADGPISTADLPNGDNFVWGFLTNNAIVINGPIIEKVIPAPDAEGVAPKEPFESDFNRTLRLVKSYKSKAGQTLSPAAMYEYRASKWNEFSGGFSLSQEWINKCSLTGDDCESNDMCYKSNSNVLNFCGKEQVFINHTGLEDPNMAGADPLIQYEPRLSSSIRDVYQNCFYKPIGETPNTLYPGADRDDSATWDSFPDKAIKPF